jgi:hypothetical protein
MYIFNIYKRIFYIYNSNVRAAQNYDPPPPTPTS